MQLRKEVQAIIYNRFGKETRVLLVKKLDLKNYTYRWRLLKGGIEDGETEIDALKREVFEEVGLRDIVVENKFTDYEFDFDGTLHQVASYIVKIMTNVPMKIQTDEIIDAQWVPVDQALSLLYWKDEKEGIRKIQSL